MASPLPPHKLALLNACTSASVLTFGNYTLKSGRQSPYFFNAGLLHTAELVDILGAAYAATILEHIKSSSSSSSSSSAPKSSSLTQENQLQQNQKPTPSFADFDIIFGPSYKGIPLALTTIAALHHSPPQPPTQPQNRDYSHLSYAFNRKEAKSHGEGGNIVGASLRGGKRVLIVDDVITAGTALREAVRIIEGEGGVVVGVVVALDRGEMIGGEGSSEGENGGKGDGDKGVRRSAVQELRRELGVPVLPVLTLDDLIGFVGLGQGGKEGDVDVERLRAYRERYGVSE